MGFPLGKRTVQKPEQPHYAPDPNTIEGAGAIAGQKAEAQYKPASKNKAWIGAGVGTLIFPVVGTIIGAIVGRKQKSAALVESGYKVERAIAEAEYNKAVEFGYNGAQLAPYAKKKAETEERAKYKDTHSFAIGAAVGLIIGGIIAAVVPFPFGLIIGTVIELGGLVGGYLHGKRNEKNVDEKAIEAGKQAAAVLENGSGKSPQLSQGINYQQNHTQKMNAPQPKHSENVKKAGSSPEVPGSNQR